MAAVGNEIEGGHIASPLATRKKKMKPQNTVIAFAVAFVMAAALPGPATLWGKP